MLSLRFEDNRTGHNDIVLEFGGGSWRCDSYYLALDQQLLPERENADKIRLVLRGLLEQWLSAVEGLCDESSVFLPYDFSDQYTGWLICKRSGGDVYVSRGWAQVEGWAICPSELGSLSNRPRGLCEIGPTVSGSLPALTDAARRSLAAAG